MRTELTPIRLLYGWMMSSKQIMHYGNKLLKRKRLGDRAIGTKFFRFHQKI